MPSLLCLASYFKGVDFLREARAHGPVVLLTRERTRGEAWPRDLLSECFFLPNDASDDALVDTVARWGRDHCIDGIVALEEYDVMRAAALREHFAVDGMRAGTARCFRDKLAMRLAAAAGGVRVPRFTPLVHAEAIAGYFRRVPPPWILKPRFDVSAMGVRRLEDEDAAWNALRALDQRDAPRERPSYALIEEFVAGDVYHVDSLVAEGRVIFAGVHRYARPPFEVAHRGGVFITATVPRGSADEAELLTMNAAVLSALGHDRGVAHAEFIKSGEGEFYFLEVAARVGGAFIAETLEAASGVNLWREWARLETTPPDAPFDLAASRHDHAGIALSLARQEWPDTAAYQDAEIVYRVSKRHHVGLIVRSVSADRVLALLDDYAGRFTYDFSAVVPPLERPP